MLFVMLRNLFVKKPNQLGIYLPTSMKQMMVIYFNSRQLLLQLPRNQRFAFQIVQNIAARFYSM
jgi:hypothetical protein